MAVRSDGMGRASMGRVSLGRVSMGPLRIAVAALLGLGLVVHTVLPAGSTAHERLYDAVAVASLITALTCVYRSRVPAGLPWALVIVGYAFWLVADVMNTNWWTQADFPGIPDVVYLLGYALIGVGTVTYVRSQRSEHDLMALLDASIVTVGVAVPAVAFVVAPVSSVTSLPLLGRLVATAYPMADLFLLAVLARLILTPAAHTPALRLLAASLGTTFLADCAYNLGILRAGEGLGAIWVDSLWLASYVLIAWACLHPSMRSLGAPSGSAPTGNRRKLVVLSVASMLPGVTLLVDGQEDGRVAWQVMGVGVIALSGLVLARMALMLRQVEVQAAQIAAVARVDSLTGAPNRRTWDHELTRACAEAHEREEPLSVAMIDLDHFKRYNDQHGHQGGDRLLRETVAAWNQELDPDHLLARYGGEEFAMLLPGLDPASARLVVEELRARTPGGQTFSAGVAAWHPGSEPASALAAADRALYRAKRAGRDCVLVADEGHRPSAGSHPEPGKV